MPDPTSPARRAIIDYLRSTTPAMQTAVEAHKLWTSQLPGLYQGASGGKTAGTALKARLLGEKYGASFRQVLRQIESLSPPPPAIRYHEYVVRWLKFLISACDALLNAPDDGRDTSYLRDCHDFVDDARYAGQAWTELRKRLQEAATAPAQRTAPARQ